MSSSDKEILGVQINNLRDYTWKLIQEVVPGWHKETSCLYFAQAASAALGTGWSFRAGGAMLACSDVSGWGIAVSPRDRTYIVTADKEVDADDGSYCGHCWVQATTGTYFPIVDLHSEYYGPRIKPDDFIVYHQIASLTKSIKRFHSANLKLVAQRVRRDKNFLDAVKQVAEQAQKAARDVEF